jgi:tetratricopeptide (TPR) repeat protein
MSRTLYLVVSIVAFASPFTHAAEPDPAALLKEARALVEKFPAEYRTGKPLVPLALVECLYGDREQGRKELSDLLTAVKAEKDLFNRFDGYAMILQSQQIAGLTEDAYRTIAAAWEDEKAVPEEEWYPFEVRRIYGKHVIDFYASLNDAASALRFIDGGRQTIGNTPEITASISRDARRFARIRLVESLLRYGKPDKAREVLQQTLKDYPETLKDSVDVPAAWIQLKDSNEAQKALDALIDEQNSPKGHFVRLDEALCNIALAHIEVGNPAAARFVLRRILAGDDGDKRWLEFKIQAKLGEFDEALKTANRPEKADPNAMPYTAEAKLRAKKNNLSALGVAAAKAGKKDVAERCFAEVAKLIAQEKPRKPEFAGDPGVSDLVIPRFAAGETSALVDAAAKLGNPMLLYIANLTTALELHIRKTGKGSNFLMPRKIEFE